MSAKTWGGLEDQKVRSACGQFDGSHSAYLVYTLEKPNLLLILELRKFPDSLLRGADERDLAAVVPDV